MGRNPQSSFNDRSVQTSDYQLLFKAAEAGDDDFIFSFFKANSTKDINARNYLHQTAIILAAEKGHASTVKLLLDLGADINAQTGKDRITALSIAAQHNRTSVIKVLIDAKADLECKDRNGMTPLLTAAYFNSRDAAIELLLAGANLNAQNAHRQNIYDLCKSKKLYQRLIDETIQLAAQRRDKYIDHLCQSGTTRSLTVKIIRFRPKP